MNKKQEPVEIHVSGYISDGETGVNDYHMLQYLLVRKTQLFHQQLMVCSV